MLDDVDHLRNNPHLVQLLSHYARLGAENRETWQGRLMKMKQSSRSEDCPGELQKGPG